MTTLKQRADFLWSLFHKWRWPLFLKWAAVVAALDVYAVGIYVLWGAVRVPLFLKWTVVVAALGAYAAGIYFLWRAVPLLWRAVRNRRFLKRAVVVAALGVYAAGIYFLWGAVREPLFLKWTVVVAALCAYAAGIYLLWGAVREPLFLKWAAVVAALCASAVGILLLWGVWDGTPVAAAFTRVGGATHVETALEASRFWLTPPHYVVKTQTDSSQLMLGAAQCAIVHDAPLLFTSPDRKRQRRVGARIDDWRKNRKREGVARLEVISIKSQPDVTKCVGKRHRADIPRLSTLQVPDPLFQLRRVQRLQTLAPVVVFAAAVEPGHPPDVAVGLALGAHLAKANREKVSLVVVPHYLESDLELEKKLQSQHEPVTGGVVLGQTPTVPEDTRALLRQLLTSRDRQGVLAQVQDNLGSAGTLIAALLALFGVATATRIGGPIVIEHLESAKQKRAEQEAAEASDTERPGTEQEAAEPPGAVRPVLLPTNMFIRVWRRIVSILNREKSLVPMEKSDWRTGLRDNQVVTVWLRSGRQVTGTIESQIPANTRDATVFRIKKAPPDPNVAASPQKVPPPGPEGKYAYAFVSVKEIEQIHF